MDKTETLPMLVQGSCTINAILKGKFFINSAYLANIFWQLADIIYELWGFGVLFSFVLKA